MHVKEPRTLIMEELGVYPGVSGSRNKRPCLQVSSGLRATVLRCAFEASLVSLPKCIIIIIKGPMFTSSASQWVLLQYQPYLVLTSTSHCVYGCNTSLLNNDTVEINEP